MNKGGIVVCHEGMDTGGKSTQTNLLKKRLDEKGLKVATIHFPRYESPIGSLIGKLLNHDITVTRDAFQMLYVADFMDFQEELKRLRLENDVVILDRYFFSTYVFAQAAGVEFDEVFDWTKRLIIPDKTFVLDLSPDEIAKRKGNLDKHESDYKLMKNVRQNYKKLPYQFEEKGVSVPMQFLDATRDVNSLNDIIFKGVMNLWQTSKM